MPTRTKPALLAQGNPHTLAFSSMSTDGPIEALTRSIDATTLGRERIRDRRQTQ